MKYILALLLLFPVFSFAQSFGPGDTVFNNVVSMITATSARINGNTLNGDEVGNQVVLKYVRVGHTDTTTGIQAWPNALFNLTGLVPSTQYVYYYAYSNPPQYLPQIGRYYFTTLGTTTTYAAERSTVFPYTAHDSGLKVPRADTSLYRTPPPGYGSIVFKKSDSTFYGYRGDRWIALGVDSAGIMPALNLKVDSVTVYGDSLWYWVNGTQYGYVLPTAVTFDATVDFSVNPDPNTVGTTFSPNTPHLTTKIYVSTINGSQWTWNASLSSYVIYTSVLWSTFGNAGINSATNYLGTSDPVDLYIRTNNEEMARFSGLDGNHTISLGNLAVATGAGSLATGNQTVSSGSFSFTAGNSTRSKSYAGAVVGMYNDTTNATSQTAWNALNRAFQVGIGDGSSALGANAMTVLFNGRTGLGKLVPTEVLDVSGNVRFSGALMPNNTAGTSGQVLTSAGAGVVPTWTTPASSGANTALSNLASVAINTSLLPSATNSIDLGSSSKTWKDIYGAGKYLNITNNTSDYQFRIGSFLTQSYALNNGFISDNAYFNGSSWTRNATGYASGFQFYNGQLMIHNINTGTGAFTQQVQMKSDYSGKFGLGVNIASAPATYTGATFYHDAATGFTGINDITPSASLDVTGGVNITDTLRVAGESHLMGNVGVGTDAPGYPLDVNGSFRTLLPNSSDIFEITDAYNGNSVMNYNVGTLSFTLGDGGAKINIDGTGNQMLYYGLSGHQFATGNVGIGVAPTVPLDVTGEIKTSTVVTHTAMAFASLPTGVAGMVATVNDSNTIVWGATIAGGGGNTVLAFFNGTNWTVIGK